MSTWKSQPRPGNWRQLALVSTPLCLLCACQSLNSPGGTAFWLMDTGPSIASQVNPLETATTRDTPPPVAAPAAVHDGLAPIRESDSARQASETRAFSDIPDVVTQTVLGSSDIRMSHPHVAPRRGFSVNVPLAADCFPASEVDSLCAPAMESDFRPSDEYLCDGGDQQTQVRVNRNWEVSGLDLEDTVAHYDTLDGRTIVTPSNSVCIYAPRFAAVRQVVLASEDALLLTMQAINAPVPAIIDDATRRAALVDQPLPPLRDVGLQGPIAVRHRTRGIDLQNALPVVELVRDFAVHEDFQIVRLGIHQRSQRAEVERYAEAALVWTDNLAPEVMLDAEPAEVDVTVEKIGTEYHIGLEGSPRLRVIKLASTGAALPGEEVTFTLRFDNTGEQAIGNVTIMDNLTTRLEYVDDSAECSRKADFFVEDNQGESLALRWEIRDPIRPGDGGIIRFRCRVR